MITVYAYDATTKEYLGTTQAQESPLEKGVILMPANATYTPSPLFGENHTAVWNGSSWDTVTDLRGTVYYDAEGSAYTQKELGDLPEWALIEKPVVQEKAEKRELGQLTLGYIAKLNTIYPTLNLLATDTTEEAKTKMITSEVTFEEAGTLITFYDKGW